MTTSEPSQRHPPTSDESVTIDCFVSILRTRRIKATGRSEQARQRSLIHPDRYQRSRFHGTTRGPRALFLKQKPAGGRLVLRRAFEQPGPARQLLQSRLDLVGRRAYHLRPSNDHEIPPRPQPIANPPNGFPNQTPYPVSPYCLAETLRGNGPEANHSWWCWRRLQDHQGRRPGSPFGAHSLELGVPAQTPALAVRSTRRMLRQFTPALAVRAPAHDDASELLVHPPSTYALESRGPGGDGASLAGRFVWARISRPSGYNGVLNQRL